jgi:metal-responsive CopG/Arc/MetJ family transcriptional regulator
MWWYYDATMVRTQIQLTAELHRKLKRWSRQLGISLSEAIRRCVTEKLERVEEAPSREAMVRAALSVCGKYSDPRGADRVASNHDRWLSEIYRK